MKRRDFIKTIGIGCMGSCFNPLGVLAAGTTPLKNRDYTVAFPPLRLNPLSTSTAGITSLDNRTWDTESLLERYDQRREARRKVYLQLFGENEIDTILDEMRDSYEALIPDMPYIGENNFHLIWFFPNCQKLAEYLVAENHGITKREFWTFSPHPSFKRFTCHPRRSIDSCREGPVWPQNRNADGGMGPVVPVSGLS